MTVAGELWDMVAVGKPIKVFIESPSGEVIDLTGHITQIDISQDYGKYFLCDRPIGFASTYMPMGFDLHVQGTDMQVSNRELYVEQIHKAKEWVCAYCDHANPRAATYCGELDEHVVGCNALRPVVYDL